MVETHTHTDIAAISSRMLPKRQNMDFPQTSKNFYQVLFHILLFCSLVYADPPYQNCAGNTTDTLFLNNLSNMFESIASNVSIGHGPDTVYGQFMCYKYVAKDSCQKCLASATTDMKYHCRDSTEAVLWEEECQLRYANFPLLGKLNVSGNIPLYNRKTVDEPERFRNVVNETVHNITKIAAFNRSYSMYATTDVPFSDTQTISALVQCTVDLSADDCNSCLEVAILDILSSCCYKFRGGRLLSRSCYLRYEFYAWFRGENETQDSNNRKKTRMTVGLGIGIGIGSTISVLLLVLCIYFFARRSQTKNKLNSEFTVSGDVQLSTAPRNDMGYLNKNLQATDNLSLQELPFIDMKTINEATDNFSDLNKLGQGGFGPVYKGILPSGEEVAVKRLSLCSEQGSNEFINEVELILKLQHKNLVRLLGFCMHQEEKLLVYEFMPNRSLDVFLLDCRLRAQLNWDKRIDIINGIARGMLYLHQDSRLRIIHRDLKPSNVLLDKDMNPKISDFGMAKIFIGTDGEANTALIVGTYGYMAPEFAMEGLYSVKSDVFSFGVVLLEIITGRRNSEFRQSKLSTSLQAYAWNHWNEGKGIELMDPLLSDSCYIDEFLRYTHIGLLCVQEDAYDRPTMSSVAVMLSSEMASLLQPKKPAFFVGRLTDHETCYNNLSVNNLTMSNMVPR